ncbi:MAG: NAD(P)-binding domain-containing protein, partial [Candidatus Omnitrophica bacterium]|nr:NAD(P)-binding domain-containing protein [Candidatus Omnitrophota bacterium]
MSANITIGFLGAGKMATALAKGFLRANLVQPAEILASDCEENARTAFAGETGAKTTSFNTDLPTFASVLVMAVKPAQVNEVLSEIRPQLTEGARSRA